MEQRCRRLALVASKGSLDMAYPPLILGATAVSMGWEVSIFFTFYGMDIIHKRRLNNLKVSPIGNPAMPAPFKQLPFFHVPNVVGILPGMTAVATTFMKRYMGAAKIPSVKELLEIIKEGGGHLYACTTTMEVMGIRQEDLLDGVSCLGAAGFLEFAADADVVMFI